MNIFYLHDNIETSVQYLDDVRVRKMCLESVQILCTALNELGYSTPYKSFSPKHPCCLWVKENPNNRSWFIRYLKALFHEFFYRFEKYHKSEDVCIEVVKKYKAVYLFTKIIFNPDKIDLPQCIPNKYKQEDTAKAYQAYFVGEKLTDKNGKFILKYTKRDIPKFILDSQEYKELINIKEQDDKK